MGIEHYAALWVFCLMLFISSQGEKICYDELGCIVTDADWFDKIHRPVNPSPSPRDVIGTVFKLFSRNEKRGVVFGANNIGGNSLRVFNPSRDTKIIIHGFRSSANKEWVVNMTDSLLHKMDVNVITVDWSIGAGSPYAQAVANTRVVGLELAYLINNLIENDGANPHKFHLIGHSLGAHIAGYAGARVESLGRITGLDPAGPGFTRMPNYVRLDRHDAKFVDVIHTEVEHLGYSLKESIGDADFYPNGGQQKTGCGLSIFRWHAGETLWKALDLLPFCSTTRSQEFFIESIISSSYLNSERRSGERRCPLVGFLCDSYEDFLKGECTDCGNDRMKCSFMGIDADKYPGKRKPYLPKKFFLMTKSSPPYCGYHYALNLTVAAKSRGLQKVSGDISATIIGEDGTATGISFTPKSRTMSKGETHTFVGFSERSVGHFKSAKVTWKASLFSNLPNLFKNKDLIISHFTFSNMELCPKQCEQTRVLCTSNATVVLANSVSTLIPLHC